MDSSPPFVLRSVSLNDVTTESINLQPQNYAVVGGQAYRVRRSHDEKSFNHGIASPRLEGLEPSQPDVAELIIKLKQSEETIKQQKIQLDYQHDRIDQLEGLLRQMNVEESIIQRPFLYRQIPSDITAPVPPFSLSSSISPLVSHTKGKLLLTREKSTTSDETDVCADTPVSTFQSVDSLTPKNISAVKIESKQDKAMANKHKVSGQMFFPDPIMSSTLNSNTSNTSPLTTINDNDSVMTRNTAITIKDNDDLGLLDEDDASTYRNTPVFAATAPLPLALTETNSPDRGAPLSIQQRLSMSTTERRKVLSNVCSSRSKLSLKTKNSNKRIIAKTAAITTAPSDEEKTNQSIYSNEEENTNTDYYHNQTKEDYGVGGVGDMDKSSLSIHSQFMTSPRAMASTSSKYPQPTATTRCFWKTKQQQNPQDIYLFIAYDNPQLHKSIEQFIGSSSSSFSSTSNAHQMHVMIETHESKEKSKFLFGEICFSGFFNELEGFNNNFSIHNNNNNSNSHESQLRGSNVLVIHELFGISGDIKSFQKRNKNDHPDIIELLFNKSQANNNHHHSEQQQQRQYPIKCDEDVIQFFQGCTSRVDVILDPYHDSRTWYPYYEGSRKMAPQFRSKGIGYLRLGDDMSNYGTAFMSIDAGKTFLDNGATNIVNTDQIGMTRTRGLSGDDMSQISAITTTTTNTHKSSNTTTLKKGKSVGKKGLTTTIRKLVNTSRENSVCQSSEDESCSITTAKSSKI